MTREEAIKGLKEIRGWSWLPAYIEEPLGETGLGVDTTEMIDMAIEALSAEPCEDESNSEKPNKWIPASEPPKKEGKYLVCIEYKHKGVVVERYQMTADFYRFSHIDMSWCPDNENAAGDIVAWRELPEPYKAEKGEE